MLRYRVLTAVVLAPPVVAGIWYLPTIAISVVAAAILLLALWEWGRLVLDSSLALQAAYLSVALVMMVLAWLARPVPLETATAVAGSIGWLLVLGWLLGVERRHAASSLNWVPVKALVGLLGVVAAWVLLTELHRSPRGAAWLLVLLAVVWAADISAFFAGRRFGRRRLAPTISPKKTWAGVWGALTASALVMLAGGLVMQVAPARLLALVALGIITAAFGVVGDLFESLAKRQAGVKDSSTLLPGHGGVFDRIDSLVSAVPIYFLGIHWMNA